MRRMYVVAFVSLLFALCSISVSVRGEVIDRVLAILPGQIITLSDVEAALDLGLVEAPAGDGAHCGWAVRCHRSCADVERGAASGARRSRRPRRSTHESRASASASAARQSCRACLAREGWTKRCCGCTPPTICGSRRISTSDSLPPRSRPTKKSAKPANRRASA